MSLLNEVLSITAQESITHSDGVDSPMILNEVLSITAQEFPAATTQMDLWLVLNEVLSITAQEWRIRHECRGHFVSSMKS